MFHQPRAIDKLRRADILSIGVNPSSGAFLNPLVSEFLVEVGEATALSKRFPFTPLTPFSRVWLRGAEFPVTALAFWTRNYFYMKV
jgi:hypothetical protein